MERFPNFKSGNSIRARSRRTALLALRNMLICGLALALAGCAALELKEREMMYRPTPGRPADFAGLRPGDVEYDVTVPATTTGSSDRLHLWWLPHADPQAPTLLYLHGTFRNLFQNLRKVDALREAGFAVMAVDYRGWGESSPIIPSEATIYADAGVAWAELARRQANPRKRVIYGHSMGTGVAVELASRMHAGVDYGGLILESGFTSLPDVARVTGILGWFASWFSTEQFDSLAKIGKVDGPILIMHGTADNTVPIVLGRQLYEAAPARARWVEFDRGSHSRLDRDQPQKYQQAVRDFIQHLAP